LTLIKPNPAISVSLVQASRDIGPETPFMRAHQIMTRHVTTVGADTSVADAILTMLQHRISGLPVVDSAGALIGIISESDFVRRAEIGTERSRGRWLSYLVGTGTSAADYLHAHGRKVGEIMTPDPVTITEDTPLDRIVEIMESRGVKRLPVVRGDRLVGIVTRTDFLAPVAELARNSAGMSADDDQILQAVAGAIEQAAWRPCRLKISVHDGIVGLSGAVDNDKVRQATIVAAENVPGVKRVIDNLSTYPPPEEDLGGGDFASLQQQPSTTDDEPL
jgi:CBS domain-containing protein